MSQDKTLLRYDIVDPEGNVLYRDLPYFTANYICEHDLEKNLITLKMVPIPRKEQ